jgi:transcriptional regulator with XRE-family HTH domain
MQEKNLIFSKNLQNFLDEVRISQGDFAQYLDISHQSVNKYLRGKNLPTAENLIKILDLGCSLDYLFLNGVSMFAKNERGKQLEQYFTQRANQVYNTSFANVAESVYIYEPRKDNPARTFLEKTIKEKQ